MIITKPIHEMNIEASHIEKMKTSLTLAVPLVMLTLSCTAPKFQEVKVDNPNFYANTAFISYNDSSFPKFNALKEKYQLDTIFHGEKDEFKRILLLRHWIKKTISVGVPPPGDFTAEGILDEALKGVKFWCSYFMIVQNEVMNACGYVPRVINIDEGVLVLPGRLGHHGTNEIWSNTYHKWFYSDAMFDSHFEKNGIPLSALEIRDEYFKNKAFDIKLVNGPGRKPIDYYPDPDHRSKEFFARIFTWIAWLKQNDIYSNWDNGISYLLMYEDEYFKTHKWIRAGGKLHWAYNTKYMVLIKNREELYWTPNTITSKVTIDHNKANIELTSITPNLKSYQLKEQPGGEWKDVPNIVAIELKKDKNEIGFRVVNLAGVTGPVHTIIIER
jgi:hypothetical protein